MGDRLSDYKEHKHKEDIDRKAKEAELEQYKSLLPSLPAKLFIPSGFISIEHVEGEDTGITKERAIQRKKDEEELKKKRDRLLEEISDLDYLPFKTPDELLKEPGYSELYALILENLGFFSESEDEIKFYLASVDRIVMKACVKLEDTHTDVSEYFKEISQYHISNSPVDFAIFNDFQMALFLRFCAFMIAELYDQSRTQRTVKHDIFIKKCVNQSTQLLDLIGYYFGFSANYLGFKITKLTNGSVKILALASMIQDDYIKIVIDGVGFNMENLGDYFVGQANEACKKSVEYPRFFKELNKANNYLLNLFVTKAFHSDYVKKYKPIPQRDGTINMLWHPNPEYELVEATIYDVTIDVTVEFPNLGYTQGVLQAKWFEFAKTQIEHATEMMEVEIPSINADNANNVGSAKFDVNYETDALKQIFLPDTIAQYIKIENRLFEDGYINTQLKWTESLDECAALINKLLIKKYLKPNKKEFEKWITKKCKPFFEDRFGIQFTKQMQKQYRESQKLSVYFNWIETMN